MSAPRRKSEEKEKATTFEVWSDHCAVAAFFIFLVLLIFIS
jgi:hypothetical protein